MKIIANFLNKFLDEHAKNEIDELEKGNQRDSIYDVIDDLIMEYHNSPDRSIHKSKGELIKHEYSKWIYTYFYARIDNRGIDYKYLLKRFVCTYRAIIRKVLLLEEEIKYKNIDNFYVKHNKSLIDLLNNIKIF